MAKQRKQQSQQIGNVTIKRQDGYEYSITKNEIVVRSVDRSSKDIGTWRNAHQSAESTHYPNRSRLYDLYADILLDGHLSGLIQKRMDSVLNREIKFVATDGKKVDAFDVLTRSYKFRQLVRLILETKLWGISGAEFIPGAQFDFVEMRRKHIKPHIHIYAKEQSGEVGVDYLEAWNLWVIGEQDDLGLLLNVSPYALYKRGALADWSQYLEIFGMPVRVIRYDAHDTQTKQELDKALRESGSALEIRIPLQASFEMLDGKASNGDGKLQQSFRAAMNEEMSVIILGNTETTTSSQSSGYAQAESHASQQMLITHSDMEYVRTQLNSPQFLAILQSYGFPVADGHFEIAKDIDYGAVKAKMEVAKQVRELGLPLDPDEVYQVSGWSKPANFSAETLALPPGSTPPANTGTQPANPPTNTLTAPEGLITKIRTAIADFFDPAPSR